MTGSVDHDERLLGGAFCIIVLFMLAVLRDSFGVDHSTIQLERDVCPDTLVRAAYDARSP